MAERIAAQIAKIFVFKIKMIRLGLSSDLLLKLRGFGLTQTFN